MSILAFLLVVALVVTVHEWGHFLVARLLSVKVLRFSIGFGKPLFRYLGKAGTEYVVALFPLGGYVKMLDENEGPVAVAERPFAFNVQPVWKRALIVFAGPLFNFLFAVFLYTGMLMIGVDGIRPIVGAVSPKSVAFEAGLQTNDQILMVNGVAALGWDDIQLELLAAKGQNIPLEISRQSQALPIHLPVPDTLLPTQFWSSMGFSPLYPPLLPKIDSVMKGSAGEVAGLQANDEILAINGASVTEWQKVVEAVRTSKSPVLAFTILRNGTQLIISVKPEDKKLPTGEVIRYIGVLPVVGEWPPEFRQRLQFSLWPAVRMATDKTWQIIQLTGMSLGSMLAGQENMSQLGGPVSIAKGASASLEAGWSSFVKFLIIISVGLGVINLLPIPALDGGHLLFYGIEACRGRPISKKMQYVAAQAGFMVLGALMMVAFVNDFQRFW